MPLLFLDPRLIVNHPNWDLQGLQRDNPHIEEIIYLFKNQPKAAMSCQVLYGAEYISTITIINALKFNIDHKPV